MDTGKSSSRERLWKNRNRNEIQTAYNDEGSEKNSQHDLSVREARGKQGQRGRFDDFVRRSSDRQVRIFGPRGGKRDDEQEGRHREHGSQYNPNGNAILMGQETRREKRGRKHQLIEQVSGVG